MVKKWRVVGCDLGASINEGCRFIFYISHRLLPLGSDIFLSSRSLSVLCSFGPKIIMSSSSLSSTSRSSSICKSSFIMLDEGVVPHKDSLPTGVLVQGFRNLLSSVQGLDFNLSACDDLWPSWLSLRSRPHFPLSSLLAMTPLLRHNAYIFFLFLNLDKLVFLSLLNFYSDNIKILIFKYSVKLK